MQFRIQTLNCTEEFMGTSFIQNVLANQKLPYFQNGSPELKNDRQNISLYPKSWRYNGYITIVIFNKLDLSLDKHSL